MLGLMVGEEMFTFETIICHHAGIEYSAYLDMYVACQAKALKSILIIKTTETQEKDDENDQARQDY